MIRTFIFLALLALPAYAGTGPERRTFVSDRLVATTPTHFYVLRDVSDNHGSYYYGRTDQYLVEIDLVDGQAINHWLLRSMRLERAADILVYDYPTEPHNMMEILAERGGIPANERYWGDLNLTVQEDKNGDMLDIFHNNETLIMSKDQLEILIKNQMFPLTEYYLPLQTQEDYDDLDRINFDMFEHNKVLGFCYIGPNRGAYVHRAQGGDLRLARITCNDSLTFYMILPNTIWE